VKRVVTLRILVEARNERDEQMLEGASNSVLQQAAKQFRTFHYSVLGSEVGHNVPTKEESMRLIPRKMHWGIMNCPICSDKMVPASRLTEDWARVDCKMCLKRKPKTMQTELSL
jgi:hypothetical protein